MARVRLQMSRHEFGITPVRDLLMMLDVLGEHDTHEDFRHAQTASIIANVNRNPETKPDPFTPFDFMPGWEKVPAKPKSKDEQIADILRVLTPRTLKRRIRAKNVMDAHAEFRKVANG